MDFGQPQYLHLLWLIIGFVFLSSWGDRNKQRKINRFCNKDVEFKIINQEIIQVRKTKFWLMTLTIIFLLIAMSQPRWGFRWEDVKQEGVDIIVAMDVSNSMMAGDIKPNRLERAKRKVTDLIRMMKGDRIGLVAFAGTSFVQCPLTLDYSAAEIFLDIMNPDLIPVQGTDLGHAIQTSINSFSTEEETSKALILITDGEDHGGDVLKAAGSAKDNDIKIFTIGIGQETGAPVPGNGVSGGFKTDSKGEVVLSKLDEFTLQQIAILTGGSYVRSVTGDLDLQKIYLGSIKKKVKKKELKSIRRQIWNERFQWFLLISLVLLTIEWTMNERKIIS